MLHWKPNNPVAVYLAIMMAESSLHSGDRGPSEVWG